MAKFHSKITVLVLCLIMCMTTSVVMLCLLCLLRLHHVPHFLSIVSGTYVTCILSYLTPNCAFANKPYFILSLIFSFTLMIRTKTSRPRLFDLQNPQRLQSFPFNTTKHVLPSPRRQP